MIIRVPRRYNNTTLFMMLKLKCGRVVPARYWTYLAIFVLIANIWFLAEYLTNSENPKFSKFDILNREDSPKNTERLIDLKNFKYLISKSGKSFGDTNESFPFFVIAVNSKPANKEMRQAIRDSWGRSHKSAKTFFFLASVGSDQIQREIIAEDKEFGDIIQGNFLDNQHNSPYKHVMMLKWFVENCPGAEYLIKVDDDVFSNVPAIHDFLTTNLSPSNFLMGIYHEPELCPRNGSEQITYEEYASDFYPAYAERHSIIYSSDVASQLLRESELVNFFWVEDVFVTGILRSQINIDIISIEDHLLSDRSLVDMRESSVNLPHPQNFMFSKSNISIQDQMLLWERTEWYRLGEKAQL